VDGKTAIQVLDRLDPRLPCRQTDWNDGYEYRRNGMLSLYAALDENGNVHCKDC
jgi:hypothetical protein